MLSLCRETENKTIKYWTACTEKMAPKTEEGAEGAEEVPKVENLEQYAGDPMPHLLIYLKGDLKASIDVRLPDPPLAVPAPIQYFLMLRFKHSWSLLHAGSQRAETDQDSDRVAGGVQAGRIMAVTH